ncbi:hypothetical protein LV476_05640 [Guyparkeria hydrothermalis]|uniref:hypothetical protein n=1 Tax=Guyparkeria hydrothermalis TaxID=923 RepID=UPI002021E1D1|nr:hypothetical protein [Guyparkeria hydrothermalis]MCL7744433.1 hypothetical protein [Guyparkeria hydrothermalis]
MSTSTREILTSQAIKFALDWLAENRVEIEPLKRAVAAEMERWDYAQRVPRAQCEAIVELAASRAVRQHIERLKARRFEWTRA